MEQIIPNLSKQIYKYKQKFYKLKIQQYNNMQCINVVILINLGKHLLLFLKYMTQKTVAPAQIRIITPTARPIAAPMSNLLL